MLYMNRKFRSTLFALLTMLFLITAPTTILYYMGWRFDWPTKTITQTGIFYFKVSPRESKIYIDHEFKKKTGFFFNSALIENLTPKEYFVEIEKQGFYKWEKFLEIKKRQVTEIKNITLIPENPNFTIISEKIENFYPAPDNKKIILQETYYIVENTENLENSEELILSGNENPAGVKKWSLKLFDLGKDLKSKLIDEDDIIAEIKKLDKNPSSYKENNNLQIELINLTISSDSKRILIEIKEINTEIANNESQYLTLDLNKAPDSLELIPVSQKEESAKIENVYFSPENIDKFLILSSCGAEGQDKTKELQELDMRNGKTYLSVLDNIVYVSVIGKDIYYIDKSGFVFKNNFSFDRAEKLNFRPFYLNPESKYEIYERNSNIFLRENNSLYLFDQDKKVFGEFFESVQNLKFAIDSKKMVYCDDYEARVFFLEKIYDQPTRNKYENIFLTNFSEKISDIFWYTDHYLLFLVGDTIKIVEIDDRDKVNIVDLIELEQLNSFQDTRTAKEIENQEIPDKEKPMLTEEAGSKIFWNQDNKKLYILFENNVYASEELIR